MTTLPLHVEWTKVHRRRTCGNAHWSRQVASALKCKVNHTNSRTPLFWHMFWHIFRHIFWRSFWHISSHFFRRITWQSFWHSVWHAFWPSFCHSVWHVFWDSFLQRVSVNKTFCLAYLLLRPFWHSCRRLFWHFSRVSPNNLSDNLSGIISWHFFGTSSGILFDFFSCFLWHSLWQLSWHSVWLPFWHLFDISPNILLTFFRASLLAFRLGVSW